MTFLVLSLPRSRSAWMAHFLSYGGALVSHDLAPRCTSVAEFKDRLAGLTGSCETGAVLGWRLIREELPELKLAVVLRDPREVYASLAAFGIDPDLDDLVQKWEMLGSVAKLPGTLTLQYSDLTAPWACKVLFEHCLDLPFDWRWWEELDRTNIQVQMETRLQYLIEHRPQIEQFKAEVAQRTAQLGDSFPWLH